MPYKCSKCSVNIPSSGRITWSSNSKYDFSWNSYLNHLWALQSNKFWRKKKWFAHFWIFARYIVQHKEIKKEANFPPSKCTLWLYMYFHSSEIRCLCLKKSSIETLTKMKKKMRFFFISIALQILKSSSSSTNQFFPKSVEYKRQHTFIKSSWYYVVGIVKTCLLGIPSVNHDMGCIHKNVPTWTFSIPLKNLKVN